MEILATLGRTLGFSFAAGINLYATVAILGLASRYGWVALPEQFKVFDNDLVIGAALVLYVIEFVADKIPWVDSLWDAVHTFVRVPAGAALAWSAAAHLPPGQQVALGLLGGTLAFAAHGTKLSLRAGVNTSPEPFTNWALSLLEDAFVVVSTIVAAIHPAVALAVVALFLALAAAFAVFLWRAFGPRPGAAAGPAATGR
jgi:hypothetical protein